MPRTIGPLYLIDAGPLPTASSTYRGGIYCQQGATGIADTFWVCMKLADDTYDWVQIV